MSDPAPRRLTIGYLCQMGAPDFLAEPPSGPALHVRHVVAALRDRGHEVRLVAPVNDRPAREAASGRFEPLPPTALDRPPLRWIERGVRRVQSALALPYIALFDTLRFVGAVRPALTGCDLILERAGWMGYGGAMLARLLGIPLVLEVNGDHLREFEIRGIAPRGAQRRLSMALTGWAARQAALIIATGEGWRESFVGRWGLDPDRSRVVENGSEIVALLERTRLRAFDPDGASDAVTAVFVGSFEPWQGLDVLLRATARVLMRGVPVRIELIGDGPLRQEIEETVRTLGLDGHVTLTGALAPDALAGRLARAEIGLSTYCGRDEYSGLKLLDYKGAGLATIASGRDGQPAVIRDERTGLIVPPCDEAALAAAIERLVIDPDLRARLGRAARAEAEERHGWDRTALELERELVGIAR